jgi:aspartate/methionine/tyrosine aminotransferase
MPKPSDRVGRFTESVIRGMTRVANASGAINLAQGFPDFDPPAELRNALAEAAHRGPHQYAVTWGAANFRAALAEKQSRLMNLPIDPDTNVVVTCGGTEAMMAAMMTACNSGDRVVVFSPFYENYAADAILCGAQPIYVPLHPPHFRFDPTELRAVFNLHHPKALVLCNPSNPTGRVFTHDELKIIADLVEEFDAYVITDEVYEHIVYAPHRHTYFAGLEGMWERTFSCGSLSKTYSITGWRLGYVIAPEELISQARKVHDFLTVGAAAPLQEAAVAGLRLPESYYQGLANLYTGKRALFLDLLRDAGLSFHEPEGAYFVMVDVTEFGVEDDVAFAEWMAREIGVAGVPGSSFFRNEDHRFIRFHFAKGEPVLRQVGERLKRLKEKAVGKPWRLGAVEARR